MQFDLECKMFRPVNRWLKSDGFQVRDEFALPWGICDLVGVRFRRDRVKERLALGQREPIGPPLRIDVLMRIPPETEGHSIRLRTLQRNYADILDQDAVSAQVERLIAKKFLKRTRYGLQRLNGWHPLHDIIIAVELKRYRITEALEQASRHLRVATQSYVGLPVETARRVVESRRRLEFEHCGVGVLGISPRKCHVLLESSPVDKCRDDILQVHTTERFWRAYPKGS